MLAFPFSSSVGSHDISSQPGRVGEERQSNGVGVSGQMEGREVRCLAFQRDDGGECVWFGKWVGAICVLLRPTVFFVVVFFAGT